jgi:hypothetical protein
MILIGLLRGLDNPERENGVVVRHLAMPIAMVMRKNPPRSHVSGQKQFLFATDAVSALGAITFD